MMIRMSDFSGYESLNTKEGFMKESGKNGQIHQGLIQGAGGEMKFILIRPRVLKADTKYPLFVFIHGRGGDPKKVLERDYDAWTGQNFFSLIPQGIYSYELGYSWYNRRDAAQFEADLVKDEKVVTELVSSIKTDYAVDASKIYLGGFSQGGRLAFYIGFRNPEFFRGILPVGGVFMEQELNLFIFGAKNLQVDIFHGTEDRINSFESMKAAFYELKKNRVPVTLTSYPLDHEYTSEILTKVLSKVE